MADTPEVQENTTSYLEMSDEDIMKAGPPGEVAAPEEDSGGVVDKAPAEVVESEDSQDKAEDSAADDEEAGTADEEDSKEDDSDTQEKVEKPEKADSKVEKPKDPSAVDYETEYKRLLAPFKANGRDVEVKSVEDAIALMQMGANYNKKMAALKPNLKLMKMLENNGLLSEDKLSFLIDLDKKSPEAINKLVKDSGINPMDLDADKASEYKPKIHAVDDREIDLDTVLDEIQDSSSYNRTLEIVSQKWDGASKQVIAGQPQLLKVINSHVESGIYDLISKEIASERVFGRLNGVSDIEAYRQIGDAMQAKGRFNHLGSSQSKAPAASVVVQPKPKKLEDGTLKDKRRAASSTKPVAPTTTPTDFNPLSMSDEEFRKMAAPKFR